MTARPPRGSATELTARARILAAAVQRFAVDGLAAPLRTVAADAGVSAGLIIHHFESRDGLLAACDHEILELTRDRKRAVFANGAAELLMQMAQAKEYAPAVGYVLRRLQAGGPMAAQLLDDFVADAVEYLREGERTGVIRPSRDPEARARLLTEMGLGALLLQMPAQRDQLDMDDLPALMHEHSQRIVAPYLELLTEPMLTNSSMLDALTAQQAGTQPPTAESRSTEPQEGS